MSNNTNSNSNSNSNSNTLWGVSTTEADDNSSSGPSTTESYSETQILWGNIIFSLLWFIGISLLIILIVCIVESGKQKQQKQQQQHQKQQDRGGASTVDVEEQARPPKGRRRSWILLIPLFAILVATSLSIVAHTSCEFVKLLVWDSTPGTTIAAPMSIGIWSVAFPNPEDTSFFSTGICYYRHGPDSELLLDQFNYHDDEEDEMAMTLARVSAVLATIVGAAGMMVFLYASSVSVTSDDSSSSGETGRLPLHGLMIAIFGIAAVLQAMTFAVFRTDYCVNQNQNDIQCQKGDGAVSSFTAVYYWLLVDFALFVVRLLQNNNNNNNRNNNRNNNSQNN